jgi:hypothetical protein
VFRETCEETNRVSSQVYYTDRRYNIYDNALEEHGQQAGTAKFIFFQILRLLTLLSLSISLKMVSSDRGLSRFSAGSKPQRPVIARISILAANIMTIKSQQPSLKAVSS